MPWIILGLIAVIAFNIGSISGQFISWITTDTMKHFISVIVYDMPRNSSIRTRVLYIISNLTYTLIEQIYRMLLTLYFTCIATNIQYFHSTTLLVFPWKKNTITVMHQGFVIYPMKSMHGLLKKKQEMFLRFWNNTCCYAWS